MFQIATFNGFPLCLDYTALSLSRCHLVSIGLGATVSDLCLQLFEQSDVFCCLLMAHTTSTLIGGSMAQMKLSSKSRINFRHLKGNRKVGPRGPCVPLSHPIASINKASVLATRTRLTIKGSDAVSLFEFVCARVGHICPSESPKPVFGGRAVPLTYGT